MASHGETRIDGTDLQSDLKLLFRLSESRGVESAGVAYDNGNEIACLKKNIAASKFLKLKTYRSLIQESSASGRYDAIIAHARMVTNGTSEDNRNNQPVVTDSNVLVHNGIITNESELHARFPLQSKRFDVDSEWLGLLLRHFMDSGLAPKEAVSRIYEEIKGAASFACLFPDRSELLLSSNTGSVYCLTGRNWFVFASERAILRQYQKQSRLASDFEGAEIVQIRPGDCLLLPVGGEKLCRETDGLIKPIRDRTDYEPVRPAKTSAAMDIDRWFEDNSDRIGALRRCTKCLLAETFPFITFNAEGVCNYCLNHPAPKLEPRLEEFEQLLDRYRQAKGNDCVMAMSGGRDSSYGLHVLIRDFGMRPVTFTYDWGMVTDIARRNIANMCGELGVENILISANIPRKRDYIRKNVSAWLKRPSLGVIPLFMAGDKFFFKYVNRVKAQTGLRLNVWSANQYENTDFKSGFAGIPPNFDPDNVDSLSLLGKMQMPLFYAKEFLSNPGYINSSIFDTLGAYWSYYFEPRDHICLMFNYLVWNEQQVEDVLIDQYGWEVSPTTNTTWRIGDGTAAFYNYIYLTMAGFTEFDTFRSNQIRAGVMTREEGLAKIQLENRPQAEGFRWYCETVGLDVQETLKAINGAPKLYTPLR